MYTYVYVYIYVYIYINIGGGKDTRGPLDAEDSKIPLLGTYKHTQHTYTQHTFTSHMLELLFSIN